MAAVVPINALVKEVMDHNAPVAKTTSEQWQAATFKQREVASSREQFLKPVLDHVSKGGSANVAIRNLLKKIESKQCTPSYMALAESLGRAGKVPGRSTIHGWLKAYQDEGKSGLLDKYTGRVRKDYGWEALAVQLFQNPNQVSYQWVARRLREYHDFESATDSRVTKYLKSLPETLGKNSPARIGKHLYNNSQKNFISRTCENVPVGAIYQADGHTIDVYLEHPNSGSGTWRAELTVFMDVKSRFIVGWHLSSAESGVATIQAIGRSLLNHDHVPAILYVDNGCGYKSKIMSDEAIGFYNRFNIQTIFAIPGNAKAKGQVERFFRTMERDYGVSFGEAFCGEGHSKEVARVWYREVKAKRKKAPTLGQWCDGFTKWLENYHNRPHPEFPDTTPHELWSTLERTPLHIDPEDVLKARESRVVQRSCVTLHNRKYYHPILIQHNSRSVVCEYSFEDDTVITVRDESGRLICDAELDCKKVFIPQSRLDEQIKKSRDAAVKRLEAKIHEVKLRSGALVENNHQYEELHELQSSLPEPEPKAPDVDIDLDIDLNEFD
ncbi:MAG: hypothetical protein C9356_12415 [Oleiphilus sp.]|nr:MAG: hypothetical protein C9356_12415 [Oleiphilus sp.]